MANPRRGKAQLRDRIFLPPLSRLRDNVVISLFPLIDGLEMSTVLQGLNRVSKKLGMQRCLRCLQKYVCLLQTRASLKIADALYVCIGLLSGEKPIALACRLTSDEPKRIPSSRSRTSDMANPHLPTEFS